jgi:2-polyprenyl-6-methoxyphenol hydroxylase-like FAD-dependent oxidoreductase
MSSVTGHRTGTVLVAGGGIGGLTTALCLARAGREVRVLERAAAYGEIGAGIQLAPNATRILERLGFGARLREVGVLPRRLVLADALTGDELTHLPLDDFPRRYGGPYVVLHRGDLLAMLLDACRTAGVALETGCEAHDVAQDGPVVHVRCGDGRAFEGALLVAADGLNSRMRARISPDEPISSGYVAYRGAVPLGQVPRPPDVRDVVASIGPGLHLVQYALRAGELLNTVGVFRSAAFTRGEADWGTPDELDAAFACTTPQVRESTALLGRDQRWPMYDRLPIGTWARGRVALLGDAAHPMLQYLAQGACQAIQDADALGRALSTAPGTGRDAEAALACYQEERSPRAARVQSTARTWGELWHVDGVARSMRNRLLRDRDPDDHEFVEWLYGT